MLPPSSLDLAATDTDSCDRRNVFHAPAELVHAVHGLLDKAIATEPGEVIPIADLPLHICSCQQDGCRAFGIGFDRAGVRRCDARPPRRRFRRRAGV